MSEPRPGYEVWMRNADGEMRNITSSTRAVTVVISPEWAQVLTRLQQLHHQGCTLVRLMEDGQGRVRIEPDS